MMKLRPLSLLGACALAIGSVSMASLAQEHLVRASKGGNTPEACIRKVTEPSRTVLPRARHNNPASQLVQQRPMKLGSAERLLPMRLPSGVAVYGSMIYADSWTDNSLAGIYSVTMASEPALNEVKLGYDYIANGGGTLAGDRYIFTSYEAIFSIDVHNYIYDAETWELIGEKENADITTIASDMAYDPLTKRVYGCFYNADLSGYDFGVLDIQTFERSTIAPLNDLFIGMAFSPKGVLYAVTNQGRFGTIDKNTGEFNQISEVEVTSPFGYVCSMVYDSTSNMLYATSLPNEYESKMYSIDPATGEATFLFDFPDAMEMAAMFIPGADAAPMAPSIPTLNSVDFTEGSLEGTITFTAPKTLHNGAQPAAGEKLDYTVMINGENAAQGSTTFGATVTTDLTVAAAGMYEIAVYVSNADGDSPVASKSLWIGTDVPESPKNVTLNYRNEVMTLSWDAVTSALNGGYFDPDAVTYNVTRKIDNEVVATGLTETKWSETIVEPEELTMFSYYVTAVFDGSESAPAESNKIVLGVAFPPFTDNFEDEALADAWTIYDSNGDGITWGRADFMGETIMQVGYNPDDFMNDWLMSPPLYLEAGKLYKVSIDAANMRYPERIEAFIGTAAAPFAMLNCILESTDITDSYWRTLQSEVTVESDGIYYIGYHGISDADQYFLMVDNFRIEEGLMLTAPDAPVDFNVAADFNGGLSATVNFDAPTVDIAGGNLSSLSRIDLYCDDNLVKTFENPAPGEHLSFSYSVDEEAYYTFRAVTYNESGRGKQAEKRLFVGVNIPGVPQIVTASEVSDGRVHVSWSKVDKDIDGMPMNPDFVKYTVMLCFADGSFTPIAEKISETEITYDVCEPDDPQQMVYFAVLTSSSRGDNEYEYGQTSLISVGAPYELPYEQGFEFGSLGDYLMGMRILNGDCTWTVSTEDELQGVYAPDGDFGFLCMRGSYIGDQAMIFTGKVALRSENPILSFYVYGVSDDDENELEIGIRKAGDTNVKTISNVLLAGNGWRKVQIPLNEYAGETVQIHFTGTVNTYALILLDHIFIGEAPDYNLAVSTLRAQANVDINTDFDLSVTISNYGRKEAQGYNAELLRDGEVVMRLTDLPTLLPGEEKVVIFTQNLGVVDAGSHIYSVDVNFDNDEDNSDNSTPEVRVFARTPRYPTVTIDGEYDESNSTVTLEWNAVSLDATIADIVEDFENPNTLSFSTDEYEDWTFYNDNFNNTYGFRNNPFEHMNEGFGWIVFDSDVVGPAYTGPDGSQRVMAAFSHEMGANNAWMISPALSGEAQTIKFSARCQSMEYGAETFEVLYSETGTSIDDFVEVAVTAPGYLPEVGATMSWKEYTAELPEGARYFAIRSTADNCFIFMVDNVEYRGYQNAGGNLTFLGYNVYRDGVKLNETPITDTRYVDSGVEGKGHNYIVTVVYAEGESAASNIYNPAGVNVGAVEQFVRIYSEGGNIIVAGSEDINVKVATLDGKLVYNGPGAAALTLRVGAGIYIVAAGDRHEKLIVR